MHFVKTKIDTRMIAQRCANVKIANIDLAKTKLSDQSEGKK